MNPQQRILMEETWHRIEDAAVPMNKLWKNTTSCYVGIMATDYYQEGMDNRVRVRGIQFSYCVGRDI